MTVVEEVKGRKGKTAKSVKTTAAKSELVTQEKQKP